MKNKKNSHSRGCFLYLLKKYLNYGNEGIRLDCGDLEGYKSFLLASCLAEVVNAALGVKHLTTVV